jgi:anti-sigma factor RsiW
VNSHDHCGEVRLELAVYVLGALEPGDRSVVDRHLADCAYCRDELAGLAGLPALLRRVSPAEASALAGDEASTGRRADLPSGPALRRLLTGASRDRRRRRVRVQVAVAAAAGLVVGAGVITGWQAAGPAGGHPAASAPAWAASAWAASPQTGVSATVRYAARAWGVQMIVQVRGVPAGTTCELDVISSQGQVTTAGGWTMAGGQAWYPASSSEPLTDVRRFAVTSGPRILVNIPVPDPEKS